MLASRLHFRHCTRALRSSPAPRRHVRAFARPPQQGQAAPGASTSPGYAPADAHERIKQLQRDLQACVKAEDYERAAVLRRQLDELERSDPLLSLQKALKEAVAREAYTEAAQLQRQLSELEQQLALEAQGPVPPVDLASVPTSSDCTSPPGVRVQVQSFYAPANSRPGIWVFAYKVTLTNRSDKVLQLKSRHWIITDEDGHKEEVKGPGVVGAQPVLLPGKSFEYMSGCPLRCQQGTMEGSYTFVQLDEEDGNFKDQVKVKIGRFRLTTEGESII